MKEKRLIWMMVLGTSGLTVWRSLRTKTDPIPQLAGIGAAGVMLLFASEINPKIASGFAVLMSLAFALAWEPTQITELPTGPNFRRKINPGGKG